MAMPPSPLLLLKLVLILSLQTSYYTSHSSRRGPLLVVTGFANNILTCKTRQKSSLPQQQQQRQRQQQQQPPTPHHRTTAIFSTAPPSNHRQDENTDVTQHDTVGNLYTCQACHQKFESRNALFRHIRGEDELSSDCPLSISSRTNSTEGIVTTLMTTVVRYGYYLDIDSLDNENEMANEIVANAIHEAFLHRANMFLGEEDDEEEEDNDGTSKVGNNDNFTISTSAVTYSTATKMRQPSLRQDQEVIAATSEVMSFNYRLGSNLAATKKWKAYANNNSGQLLGHMQQALLDVDVIGNIGKNNNNNRIQIQLHQMDALIPRSSKFYAERSCTQSSYRYLLPVKWILPGVIMDDSNDDDDDDDDDTRRRAASTAISQVEEWWKQISYPQSRTLQRDHHQPRNGGNRKPKAPYFIKQMKQSLKAAESETEPNRPQIKVNNDDADGDVNSENGLADDDDDDNDNDGASIRLAHGRFGQLWRKHRRCWSNFVHRQLSGMSASPAHEALWRTMDRAIIIGLIDLQNGKDYDCEKRPVPQESSSSSPNKEDCDDELNDYMLRNMHIGLEFRADGFAVSQIPSVVSALVCMANGWLPARYFDIATRSDVYMPAPPAPPHLGARLYYQSARYHFHELAAEDDTTFEKTIRAGSREEEMWEEGLRSRMLGGLPSDHDEVEMDWLLELRDVVSPDIRQQIESIDDADIQHSLVSSDGVGVSSGGLPPVDTDVPSGEYTITLDLLRRLVESGKWPVTSDARSRVIKSPRSSSTPSDTFLTASKKSSPVSAFPGNNTISSGSFTVVNAGIWHDDNDASLPLANALFPELTKSVFELEKEIIRLTSSPLPAAEGMERQSAKSSLRRLPSTHCAVNRNAQFTPHVDSGRGLGQSKSMILGLGNYTGGEVFVEGKPYNIRYSPLEFDGWNQLHWTAPFNGERYSLVWFTPEVSQKDS